MEKDHKDEDHKDEDHKDEDHKDEDHDAEHYNAMYHRIMLCACCIICWITYLIQGQTEGAVTGEGS